MPRPTGYTDSWSSSLTGFKPVDSLISGTQWESSKWYSPGAVTNLTYSFAAPGTSYFATNYSADNEYTDMYALTTAQQNAVISALGAWSAVANITFKLTSDNVANVGDLRFAGYAQMDNQTAAWAYLPDETPRGGDVWIGPETNDLTPDKGSYDYLTFVHEIGHAIGLKHPFSPNALNSTILDPVLDNVALTVMSYNDSYSYQPTTPMLLDILAIQSLYGANNLWMTGNNVYSWAPTQSVFETIWDAGGIDTIDASNQLAAVRLDLNEGAFSQIGKAFTDLTDGSAFNEGLAIAYGAKIENATGSGFDDSLIGNALGNVLNGMGGADTMDGGAGNDSYVVDNVGDVVIERNASVTEIDTVFSSVNYTLGINVENLTLLDAANLNGTGNTLNNVIIGNTGNNILDGGIGADYLAGGTGNDTYIVDNIGDVIVETSTLVGEIDNVLASVSFTLSNNLENLTLTGTANIDGIGNASNNVITGNDGNNQLVGGAGLDTLIGGKGNDDYGLDQAGELALVQESANEGTDTLYVLYNATAQTSTVDLNLGNLHNVENVLLLGAGAFTALGNDLNNTLTGNSANNTLDGGLGADTLIGGAGADTFVFSAVNEMGTGANRDVITDFSSLQGDKIDLTKFDADLLSGGFNGFTFIGAGDFTGAGQLRFVDHVLSGNVSGNAGADFEIQLVGVNTFSAHDLVA